MQGLDLDGNEVVIEGDELLGRVFLHEIDHLDGVLMLDRLDRDERKEAMRELREQGMRVHDAGRPAARPADAEPADRGRSCASSTSARPTTRFRRCARSSTPGTTSRSS